MDFRFYLDAFYYCVTTVFVGGDSVAFPVNFPYMQGVINQALVINPDLSISALDETFVATATDAATYPSNGAVFDEASGFIFLFADNGDGTGALSKSDDGVAFTESTYTTDGGLPIVYFFGNSTGICCVDENGDVYADISGTGEIFELNGDSFPATVAECGYVGVDSAGAAVFFLQTLSGADVQVSHFTYDAGFSAVTVTDLPLFENSGPSGWSIFLINDVFYAIHFESSLDVPAPVAVSLYSSSNGVNWTLNTSGIFGAAEIRDYVSLFYFGTYYYAGFGQSAASDLLTTVYTSQAAVIANGGQSGNQGVTGGGINGAGGAVGFSGVSAASNFGQGIESLINPAGIIARGNDFSIDLGL